MADHHVTQDTPDTRDTERPLLLVEDLMLLLLDDATGTIKGEGTLHWTLGGAVLMDLALRGRVETDRERTVHAVPGPPLGDPLLGDAFERVAKRPRYVGTVLAEIGPPLRARVLDRLVERGLVRRERSKLLGFIPTTRMPPQDLAHEAALLERVRAVLEDGEMPDARTAALVAILSASGTLPQFHPAVGWSNAVASRALRYQNGDWGAAAVGTAVIAQAAAVNVSIGIAVATGVIGGSQAQ
ncbi:GOLPH3/VPS74 family protein [Cellulosimicrobium cellulans]|uniref:GOLPH3/VPS74 family protein n=1 Tax=Cellulosimicrobium cellulans TaxID=1710 RepID=UPI0008485597|nr:GPP34 family phosphoprotein [Cellulosimicrobium cellulans]